MSLKAGYPTINRPVVDSWSNYYMIQNAPLDSDMVVHHFSFFAKRAKQVQLIMYRRSGNTFSIVGTSQKVTAKLGVNRVALVSPIECLKGDLMGWYVPSNGVIAFGKGSGGWMVPGFANSTFFTPMKTAATAFKYSSNRTYSIAIEGEAPVKKEPQIVISDIFYDGVEKYTEGDEFIEISNIGTAPGNISGYRINADDKGQDFTFPEGTCLEAGASYRVYTNITDLSTGGFSFGFGRAIWNNKGDVGRLFDANGKPVDEFGYADMAEE